MLLSRAAVAIVCAFAAISTGEEQEQCPYENGKLLKSQRAAVPYKMFALGEHAPRFVAEAGSMLISVQYNSSCGMETYATWSAQKLTGGPMNVVMPLRAPEPSNCSEPLHVRSDFAEIPIPADALLDPRPLMVILPPDSDYDVYLLRQSLEDEDESLGSAFA